MSLGDEFQVSLPSNVPGNSSNVTGQYETTLARPLDLPGTWEVALIDITYPHSWVNLEKECVVVISTVFGDAERNHAVNIEGNNKTTELLRSLNDLDLKASYDRQIPGFEIAETVTHSYTAIKAFTVVPGQYDIKTLLQLFQKNIREIGHGLQNTIVVFDDDRRRIKISEHRRNFVISCYKNASLLRIMGFGKQVLNNDAHVEDLLGGPFLAKIEYLEFPDVVPLEASLPPFMNRINSIFVYTDITDYVLVGNTQTPLLGYLPVQSKWGDQAYWNFNPPYYVRVKESNIRSISIKLCTDTGEVIQFENGNVICRLNFRRVGMLRGFV